MSDAVPPSASAAPSVASLLDGDGSLPWKVQWQLPSAAAPPGDGALVSVVYEQGSQPQQPVEVAAAAAPQFGWTPFDRAASVRASALEASGWDPEEFDDRYADLTAVLPDLPSVLTSLSPAQLLGALADPRVAASKVVALKEALPNTNVGMLLTLHPPFLDAALPAEQLLAGVEHARRVLGGRAVAEEVLQWYPPLMDPEVLDASIAQLKRLVPQLARQCLPSERAGWAGTGAAFARQGPKGGVAGSDGSKGDARQLVHLLGIVMKSEGTGGGPEEDGSSLWWGCM
ncbi:hypothetical protein GPECTOR_83g284 [Gonium pectorale]|uniref:Uncharacterized protein n=1 Tax=Gonium pectorale TaxID=33097 RepID=A0A150G1C5_GONPE|nr:hypothetical protein GPECTOR_83g284 [Gonium pectorale]|eukprot:KXZ43672.1 hypothetical protein GPECTOR_83g284 [Gonium pectorale]